MFCTGSTCMTKCRSTYWIWGRGGPSFYTEPAALGTQRWGENLMSLFFKNRFTPSVSSCCLGPPAAKGAEGLWVWCPAPKMGWSAAGRRPQCLTAKGKWDSLWDGVILNLEKDWHSFFSSSTWWLKRARLCCQHLNSLPTGWQRNRTAETPANPTSVKV